MIKVLTIKIIISKKAGNKSFDKTQGKPVLELKIPVPVLRLNLVKIFNLGKIFRNQKVLAKCQDFLKQQRLRVSFITEYAFFISQVLGRNSCDAFRRSRSTPAFTFGDGGLSARALELLRLPRKIREKYRTVLGLFRHSALLNYISK